MAKILIVGMPHDTHVLSVQVGLQCLGAEVYTWMIGDMPDFATSSIEIAPGCDEPDLFVTHEGRKVRLNDFDVVWNRRRERPRAPEQASPFDIPVIEEECFNHCDNMLHFLGYLKRVVNCPMRQRRADRKAVQLFIAGQIGFHVMPTLFSNDVAHIRRFHDSHAPLIAKPHRQHGWSDGERSFNALTFDLPEPDQWEPWSIEACPLIVQKKVVRAYEVRVIAFGGRIFAAKTVDASGVVDSRMETMTNGFETMEPASLPNEIVEKCSAYMTRVGIDYGAFDFIVDEQGRWIFLECNEGGQFLYLEQYLPELNILEQFCLWLFELCGERPPVPATPLTFRSVVESEAAHALNQYWRTHKQLKRNPIILEAAE